MSSNRGSLWCEGSNRWSLWCHRGDERVFGGCLIMCELSRWWIESWYGKAHVICLLGLGWQKLINVITFGLFPMSIVLFDSLKWTNNSGEYLTFKLITDIPYPMWHTWYCPFRLMMWSVSHLETPNIEHTCKHPSYSCVKILDSRIKSHFQYQTTIISP